jgi:hypothetical protein
MAKPRVKSGLNAVCTHKILLSLCFLAANLFFVLQESTLVSRRLWIGLKVPVVACPQLLQSFVALWAHPLHLW